MVGDGCPKEARGGFPAEGKNPQGDEGGCSAEG